MEQQQGADDVPVIYLHEIKRQYLQGEVPLTILDGAKLALWAGQSVALVAPSGSGKSTLLHIAGLLESPDDGEVYVAGTPTSQLSDTERTQIRRSDIGFVYQSHRLLPEFSALENVMKYAGYFLIVSDFIKWAKSQGIPVGPGRGSAAGSLVAWCMDAIVVSA